MDENELLSDVDEIFEVSDGFRQRIEFADASWTTETEALELFKSQLDILETIRDACIRVSS